MERKGFTILELCVAICIIAILIDLSYTAIQRAKKVSSQNTVRVEQRRKFIGKSVIHETLGTKAIIIDSCGYEAWTVRFKDEGGIKEQCWHQLEFRF